MQFCFGGFNFAQPCGILLGFATKFVEFTFGRHGFARLAGVIANRKSQNEVYRQEREGEEGK
jgi:hypothetical protein